MAQNRRARKGAERLPRPRQRRLFCGVSIPCAAIYVSRLLVMGLPFWLLHDMLQRLAVERNSRDWAKTQVGVVFASYGVSLRLYRRSEEHTSELQSRLHLVCRLLLEKKKNIKSACLP